MNNLKINRITFLVFGIIFLLFGFFLPLFFIVGVGLIALAYATNKKYKELANTPDPIPVSGSKPVVEVDDGKVQVTDIDGSVIRVSPYLSISNPDRVLIVPNGKTYHTHIRCFKNWTPEMQASFTDWTIINKDDAVNKGMTYCKFCEETDHDDTTLDDVLDELERDYEED